MNGDSRLRRRHLGLLLLCAGSSSAYAPSAWKQAIRSGRPSSTAVGVSASLPDNSEIPNDSNTSYFDDLLKDIEQVDRLDEETEQMIARRRDQLAERRKMTGTYRVQLSLADDIGMTLTEVVPGRQATDIVLDLDTMKLLVVDEESQADIISSSLDDSFRGLVVKSVTGVGAKAAGVQVGDVLRAISATLGTAVWPTSTLQGVQSALSSRKLTSASVTLELRRLDGAESRRAADAATFREQEVVAQQYELTLPRPIGFKIGEDENGYVVVTDKKESASSLVRYGIAIGDRVVAVDSSLGGKKLWPVSTVEGLVSAVTSRLPGQPVTIRFERLGETEISPYAKSVQPGETATSTVSEETKKAPTGLKRGELLKRCREVLQRYTPEAEGSRATALQQMPAMVADKVVDALASASMSVDPVTLSMIMKAYISCEKPQSAIRAFEAATSFSGDGSSNPVKEVLVGKNGGQIVPQEASLNLYTGTALMQAHAASGDFMSVSRVLAALEGRSGVIDEDGKLESAPWPFTGPFGSIQPDTRCYNIAMSAAARSGGTEMVERALALFDCMDDFETNEGHPVKNVVSYNTLISLMFNAGRGKEAFDLFERMKRSGLRPDKFTYTSLIRGCGQESDVQEILYDMIERGIKADSVTYNTMIKTLCDKRHLTQATRLVTEMEATGISPDSRTYGALMNGLLKAGKPSACLSLFESASTNSITAVLTENVHIYTTAITAACVLGDHTRAIEILSRMTAIGIKPNVKTMTAVVGACLAAKQAELAAQVYNKIEQPDAYAMVQGIRALASAGKLETALETLCSQGRGQGVLSGKQMMGSFTHILHAALSQNEYDVARRVLSDFLSKNFIPSKALILSVVEACQLQSSASSLLEFSEENYLPRFRFLLFMIDSIRKRNLPVEGVLYVPALALGSQLGGDPKKVSTLMANARTNAMVATTDILAVEKSQSSSAVMVGWEKILDRYDELSRKKVILPKLPVRVASKDVGRILLAEQAVRNSRRRRRAEV